MTTTLVASSATCVDAKGNGFASTWVLTGLTTAYAGTLTTTDGYQIVATLTWVSTVDNDFAAVDATSGGTGETVSVGDNVGGGTCVATLGTDNSTELASTVTTDGNFALCHFIFWQSVNSGTAPAFVAAASGATNWGQTNFLATGAWGTAGSGITGATMRTGTGVQYIGDSYGHTLTPAGAAGATIAAGDKQFTWQQPKWASTYGITALRRYDGGGTNKESVKPYCISKRRLDGATTISAGIVGLTVVALTGAQTLAASALALGVASLAL